MEIQYNPFGSPDLICNETDQERLDLQRNSKVMAFESPLSFKSTELIGRQSEYSTIYLTLSSVLIFLESLVCLLSVWCSIIEIKQIPNYLTELVGQWLSLVEREVEKQ